MAEEPTKRHPGLEEHTCTSPPYVVPQVKRLFVTIKSLPLHCQSEVHTRRRWKLQDRRQDHIIGSQSIALRPLSARWEWNLDGERFWRGTTGGGVETNHCGPERSWLERKDDLPTLAATEGGCVCFLCVFLHGCTIACFGGRTEARPSHSNRSWCNWSAHSRALDYHPCSETAPTKHSSSQTTVQYDPI